MQKVLSARFLSLWDDLINEAPIGIFLSTEDGSIRYVNNTMARIFGYKDRQAMLSEVTHMSQLLSEGGFLSLLEELKDRGEVLSKELRSKRVSGDPLWICLHARRVSDENPFIEGFIADITDKKDANLKLQKNELQLRMLIEQAGDAFFVHDYEGQILEVNRRACETLGYSREELLRMNISDIDIEVRSKRHKDRFWHKLRPGEYITFEGVHRRKDGSTFPVEVTLGRVDFEGQSLLLSITRDITARKEAEEKLRQAYAEIKALKERLENENIYLRQEIEARFGRLEFIGQSEAIRRVLQLAEKVAKEDTCVLIIGETGTGKELLARLIHNMSPRRDRPMVTVNCAALPPTLIEAELFGVEKGAYTGAVRSRVGRFEAADGSTLFLDEVSELPLELQAKLLRVLEYKQFERVGSSKTVTVDVRVIAATNQDLLQLVREKRFRQDLYYRLSVFPIYIPPLRDRREDIPLLVEYFVKRIGQGMGKRDVRVPEQTLKKLMEYHWPGNVRELRNVIERAMIISDGPYLVIEDLEPQKPPLPPESLSQSLEEVERAHILKVLESTNWRVSGKGGAAEILGLKESTLRARMKKLGIKRPPERSFRRTSLSP